MDTTRKLSFEDLLAHASGVRDLASALVSDPGEVDDLVQDTWVAAWRHPPPHGTPAGAWLARVVRNLARNRWRSSARRRERESRSARPERVPGADEVALEIEMHRALVDALATLDEVHRTTVVRRFFHGVAASDLAREAGIPESTVRNRSKRALEALRECLDRRFGDRKTWCAALVPLATRPTAPAPATAPPSLVTIGGPMAMSGIWKLALGILAIGAFAAWVLVETQGDSGSVRPGLEADVVASLEAPLPGSRAGPGLGEPDSGRSTERETLIAADRSLENPAAPDELSPALLEARLVDPEGRPIVGAEARVCDRSDPGEIQEIDAPQARSDSQGRVRLEVRASDRSSHRGSSGTLPKNEWTLEIAFTAAGREQRRERAKFEAGTSTPLGEIALRPGGIVRGRVILPPGWTVPKVWVNVIPPDLSLEERGAARFQGIREDHVAWSSLDETGAYEIRGIPVGIYRVVTGRHVPGFYQAWTEPVDVRAGDTTIAPDLTLEENPNRIAGRVLAWDGTRPKGLQLLYGRQDPAGEALCPWTWSGTKVETDGRFGIDFPAPGTFDLYFRGSDEGGGELLIRGVTTGSQNLDLRLREPAFLEILVQGEDGRPLADLGYSTRFDGTEDAWSTRSYTNHPTGRVRIQVRALPFLVHVTGADHLGEDLGPFDRAHHPTEVAVRLRSMPSLRARVLFEGRPVPGASVSLHRVVAPGRRHACNGFPCRFDLAISEHKTDAQGRCVMRTSTAGRLAFLVRADGYAEAESEPFDVDPSVPGTEHTIELSSGGSLEGRVISRNGSPAEGLLVGISRGDGVCRIQRVGADGAYRFDHLAAGSWWVRRCPKDYVSEGGSLHEDVEGFDPSLVEAHVDHGRTTTFDLDLREAFAVLEGRFTIGFGARETWTVRLVGPGMGSRAMDGGSIGSGDEFRIEATILGPHTLVFTRAGSADRDQQLEVPWVVERGPQRVDVAVATGTIEGEAIPNAVLRHVWLGSPRIQGTVHLRADASGRFRGDGIPAGRGTLSIVGDASGSRETPVDVPANGAIRVDLP